MGLAGAQPETFDQKAAALLLEHITETKTIRPDGHPLYHFDPQTAVAFDYDTILPAHSNGMTFFAYDADGKVILEQIFYSIGGGFVQTDAEMTENASTKGPVQKVFYPFNTADELLSMLQIHGQNHSRDSP